MQLELGIDLGHDHLPRQKMSEHSFMRAFKMRNSTVLLYPGKQLDPQRSQKWMVKKWILPKKCPSEFEMSKSEYAIPTANENRLLPRLQHRNSVNIGIYSPTPLIPKVITIIITSWSRYISFAHSHSLVTFCKTLKPQASKLSCRNNATQTQSLCLAMVGLASRKWSTSPPHRTCLAPEMNVTVQSYN